MRIGTDLVEVARLRRVLERHPAFAERVFTPGERAVADGFVEPRRSEFLAGRFAAKEAVLKALGTGISGDDVHPAQVEVRVGDAREPLLVLSGGAERAARELGLTSFQVSISHDGGFALAFALLA